MIRKPIKVILFGYGDSVHTIRWVKGLAKRGFTITVITLGEEPIAGIETINLPVGRSRSRGYFRHLGKIKKLVNKLRPDLIHAHYSTGFGLWGYYSKFHPYLISVWGSDIIGFPDNFIKRIFLRKILTSADFITATSNYLKKQTLRLYPQLESKISIIPFGVEIPEAFADRKSDDIVRLVYIKKHEKIYGPDVLLAAMQKVIRIKPSIHLTLAGRGSMTAELRQQSKQLGIENSVDFCGFINSDEISSFLSQYDIMVMPSLQESFGVAVLEASAVGLPVVASNIGGVPEVLISEKTGILVPPGRAEKLSQAIIRLAENAELRRTMGQAGRKMVAEKFRWEVSLDKMAELYERLVSEAPKKA